MADIIQYAFFQRALLGVALISVAAAIIGTYIVTRRLVAISGGITHACFGGLGIGYFLGINPLITATMFAIGASAGVEWLAARQKMREDSAIAVVWALGMAIGIIFVFLTPGYVPELNTFLFGNVLTISPADLWTFGIFTTLLLAFFIAFYRPILACAFDRDFARVMHIPVRFISYAMTVLIAICIVLTIRLVGIMLLMSMFALPQLVAETFCRRFPAMMTASAVISLICSVGGLLLSSVVNVPCSALIVIVMTGAYMIARIFSPR
ncbi:MAG: metal ABC transporter permease [Paramuribaculum sp.]|nr:metal ABC transporter permease [Paramuribaculum sp.]